MNKLDFSKKAPQNIVFSNRFMDDFERLYVLSVEYNDW